MILFGAPEPMEPALQAEAAWRCATRMLEALEALNAFWQSQGWSVLQMRMGMHSGPAVVGSFGGPMRSDYTAIGDTVNLASRIQNAAEPNTMLVTEEMARHLPMQARRSHGSYQLKGIAGSQVLYELEPWRPAILPLEKKTG
ncbi:MAG: adenylate/guanylate cyclase domain-containing protein [Pseudobdellovibrionaceae bacterium]|nr:adenylate/guanylate cyclase domain-containing protein [Pseudobdellovibrionaceae bacterium]